MRLRGMALWLILALLLTFGLLSVATHANASTHGGVTISGSVTCVDQRQVEGIWVASTGSNSGWATMNGAGNTSFTMGWHFTLNNGGTYQLHVGCGGSPQNWATANYSYTLSGSNHTLLCYDIPYESPAYKCI